MKLTTQIYKLMVLFQPLLLYAMVFKVTILVQIISDFILIGSYIQLFSFFLNKSASNKPNNILAFSIMLTAFISLCYGGFSYSGFIALLMFASMISSWLIYPSINTKELNKIGKYSFLLQALLLIFFSRQSFAYDLVVEDMLVTTETLTLGFYNPNVASMIIFYVFLAILMFFNGEKRNLIKLFYVLLLSYLFYLILKTECRTTLFMCVFSVFSFFLTKGSWFGNLMKKNIVTISTLAFPILFGVLYVFLSQNPDYRDIEIMGKPLFSGRQLLYVDFYRSLTENPIIGLCSKYQFANAHNGMLTILLNTGFIGLILYIVFAYKNLRIISNRINNSKDVLCLIAIIAVFINSGSESSMLVAGNLFYVYFLYLLTLTNYSHEKSV